MDDINAQAAQIRAHQEKGRQERAATQAANAELAARDERVARDRESQLRELCERFCRYIQRARPAHTISERTVAGWILGSYNFDPNPGSLDHRHHSTTFYLVVTTSGELVETHKYSRVKTGFFSGLESISWEYPVTRNPSLSPYQLEEVRRRIAGYVAETGVPWPE
jgi:hypothetical protein